MRLELICIISGGDYIGPPVGLDVGKEKGCTLTSTKFYLILRETRMRSKSGLCLGSIKQ